MKKTSSTNIYLKTFIIKNNLIKNLIKKEALLIIKINLKSKI